MIIFTLISIAASLLIPGCSKVSQKPKAGSFLYINNAPIALDTFSKELVTNVLMATASSLKGAVEVKSLDVLPKKKD